MPWEFTTKAVRSANAVAWQWEWRDVREDGSLVTSTRTFATFKECVADARTHGFTGDADPTESGTLFRRPEARFNWY